MAGPYGKQELIDGASGYFGVEPFVAAGALSPYPADSTFTIAEAQAIIDAWLDTPLPDDGGTASPTGLARVYVSETQPTGTGYVWVKTDTQGNVVDILVEN